MRILSTREGFATDHSSTSYTFFAVDRALSKEDREKVSRLSRRAQPTRRRVEFTYNVDGYDIPGGWEPLMRDYYDVMYSESYDWWTLAMAFYASPEQQEELQRYAFDGTDDMGVRVETEGERAIVSVLCHLDPGVAFGEEHYDDWSEDEEEENTAKGALPESGDHLLDLLIAVRQQLMAGDYRALYAVWDMYGWDEDEEEEDEEASIPPEPPERSTGQKIVDQFAEMLAE